MNQMRICLVMMVTFLSSTLFTLAVAAATTQADWVKMLECRAKFEQYTSFAMGDFQDEKFKKALGIKKVKQANSFIEEYELPKALDIYGYTTNRIAFTSSGVMAIVNEKNPVQLAEKLQLGVEYNRGGKILATKVISETKPENIGGMQVWQKISKDLSTVTSHPDKTLVGCSYTPMMKE